MEAKTTSQLGPKVGSTEHFLNSICHLRTSVSCSGGSGNGHDVQKMARRLV